MQHQHKSMHTLYDIMVKLEVIFGDQNHDDRSQRKMGTSRKAGASIISRQDTKRNYPDIYILNLEQNLRQPAS